jgi:hypothetical protein
MNVAVAMEQMRELFGWDIPMMEEHCQSDLECERVLWFCSV